MERERAEFKLLFGGRMWKREADAGAQNKEITRYLEGGSEKGTAEMRVDS